MIKKQETILEGVHPPSQCTRGKCDGWRTSMSLTSALTNLPMFARSLLASFTTATWWTNGNIIHRIRSRASIHDTTIATRSPHEGYPYKADRSSRDHDRMNSSLTGPLPRQSDASEHARLECGGTPDSSRVFRRVHVVMCAVCTKTHHITCAIARAQLGHSRGHPAHPWRRLWW